MILHTSHRTISTENDPTPTSTKSRNLNSSVQIEIKSTSPCECVPRNTEKSDFLDVDFGVVVFSLDIVDFGVVAF